MQVKKFFEFTNMEQYNASYKKFRLNYKLEASITQCTALSNPTDSQIIINQSLQWIRNAETTDTVQPLTTIHHWLTAGE